MFQQPMSPIHHQEVCHENRRCIAYTWDARVCVCVCLMHIDGACRSPMEFQSKRGMVFSKTLKDILEMCFHCLFQKHHELLKFHCILELQMPWPSTDYMPRNLENRERWATNWKT